MSESNLVISIDAMGGDNSPKVVIEGLALAHKRNPDIRFLVYGDEPKVTAEIAKFPALKEVCQIFHTEEFVHNEDKPSHVIRNRETSMYKAVEAVKNGQAMAVVSAGNTGALMAISKLVLKTIQKIHRPAIVSVMPHINGKYVMLDLGANTECSAINLAEFAMMGDILARCALGISRPRVALLNIGAEEMKGKEEIHKAAQMIRNSHMNIDFIGYIEPHEIPNDKADVIVADGFTGNIALKAIEGTARLMVNLLKDVSARSIMSKLGFLLALPSLKRLKKKMDPGRYNGAMLVGLKGISIKSHGGADAFGFANAVNVAIDTVRNDLVGNIAKQLTSIQFLDEEKEK